MTQVKGNRIVRELKFSWRRKSRISSYIKRDWNVVTRCQIWFLQREVVREISKNLTRGFKRKSRISREEWLECQVVRESSKWWMRRFKFWEKKFGYQESLEYVWLDVRFDAFENLRNQCVVSRSGSRRKSRISRVIRICGNSMSDLINYHWRICRNHWKRSMCRFKKKKTRGYELLCHKLANPQAHKSPFFN